MRFFITFFILLLDINGYLDIYPYFWMTNNKYNIPDISECFIGAIILVGSCLGFIASVNTFMMYLSVSIFWNYLKIYLYFWLDNGWNKIIGGH